MTVSHSGLQAYFPCARFVVSESTIKQHDLDEDSVFALFSVWDPAPTT